MGLRRLGGQELGISGYMAVIRYIKLYI